MTITTTTGQYGQTIYTAGNGSQLVVNANQKAFAFNGASGVQLAGGMGPNGGARLVGAGPNGGAFSARRTLNGSASFVGANPNGAIAAGFNAANGNYGYQAVDAAGTMYSNSGNLYA